MIPSNILVVDLDKTLIRTDTLWESLFLLLGRRPQATMTMLINLLRGKAFFKRKIADSVLPEAALLPYSTQLLELIEKYHTAGAKVFLASAADKRIVVEVAAHLRCFDGIIGSGAANLKGHLKLEAIREISQGQPFDYAGNNSDDFPIWEEASTAYIINTTSAARRLSARLQKFTNASCIILPQDPVSPQAWLQTLRPHHWVKNFLLFLPLALAHQGGNIAKLSLTALAFVLQSLLTSSVYIINDMFDLEQDRRHPIKKLRPFASGTVNIPLGLLTFGLCLSVGFSLSALLLPFTFFVLLVVYLFLNFIYFLYLKQKVMLDVLCLAILYTLRIFAGGVVAGVPVTKWLLIFSVFLFLSLAFIKRYVELLNFSVSSNCTLVATGRGYHPRDIPVILSAGLGSGFLSVLVFFLYLASSVDVSRLYPQPVYLWLMGPFFIYWIGRIWLLANRGQISSDPVLFAIRDKASWAVFAMCMLMVMLGSSHFPLF